MASCATSGYVLLTVALAGRTRANPLFLAHMDALRPRVAALDPGSIAAGMLGRDAVVKARR